MICLGIESTAHTFGCGIITDKGKILANEKELFMTKSGGIIPNEASEHHTIASDKVIKSALEKANLKIKNIDLIAFSQSPGLGHTLRIGAMAARSISQIYNIPIIGVNHCIAHLEIGRMLCNAKDPVLLYTSGANTQIIAYEGQKYRIFGETLDIGVGNFLDTFARELGFGFPGGPKIYELACQSINMKGNYIELPYVVKGMDVSFGGILTNLKQKIKSGKYSHEDLCYSAQETVFAMLLEVTERAMAHTQKKELLLGGGVACNKRLKEMANIMCKERNAKCYVPPNQFLVDNGLMIAWTGLLQYQSLKKSIQNNKATKNKSEHLIDLNDTKIDPYQRTDDVIIYWR